MPKLLIVAMLVLCSPALAQETASFRGNAEHTGVYSAAGAATVHKIKWQFHTGGKIFSSPAVAGSTVYFGSYDHFLRAVDLETGAEKWKFTGSRIPSSPAVANGLVYFLSYDSNFYALDLRCLMSANSSSTAIGPRCGVREQMIHSFEGN